MSVSSHIVTVVGVVGGVGTTTAAVSRVRSTAGPSTALDLDLCGGDLARRFDVGTTASVVDLVSLGEEDITSAHLDAVSYSVGADARVIASPADAELAELVTDSLVERVLEAASERGLVIVDGGSRMDTRIVTACRMSHEIVFVADVRPFSLGQVGKTLDMLRRAGVTDHVHLNIPRSRCGLERSVAARLGISAYRDTVDRGRGFRWRRSSRVAAGNRRERWAGAGAVRR